MSIAAAPLAGTPVADQKRLTRRTNGPGSRILIAKPDAKLVPEPR